MPTGYTAKLMQEGQTFPEFVMTCARAFGALIDMRDSPIDAPIPDKFEPSSYHSKKIIEATETLEWLNTLSSEEKVAYGEKEKAKENKRNQESLRRELAENIRLEEMAAQVRSWTPPSKDHQELKNFMLQQINISKNSHSYYKTELEKAQRKAAIEYYEDAVANAERDIKYHAEENKKEIERTNGRTQWVKQLRESI